MKRCKNCIFGIILNNTSVWCEKSKLFFDKELPFCKDMQEPDYEKDLAEIESFN